MNLSAKSPENRFAAGLDLNVYSRGMGAIGHFLSLIKLPQKRTTWTACDPCGSLLCLKLYAPFKFLSITISGKYVCATSKCDKRYDERFAA